MITLLDLCTTIAETRRGRNLTQLELAQKARISRATLDALENHRGGEIGFSKIARLLAVLGLELHVQHAQSRRPTLEDLIRENLNADA